MPSRKGGHSPKTYTTMKKTYIYSKVSAYETPRVEEIVARVESGFGNSLGLGDLETEEGELYY